MNPDLFNPVPPTFDGPVFFIPEPATWALLGLALVVWVAIKIVKGPQH